MFDKMNDICLNTVTPLTVKHAHSVIRVQGNSTVLRQKERIQWNRCPASL
jgi:hypothetical protein